MKKTITLLFMCILLQTISSQAQVTGTDTVCPAYIYTFDAVIPGAATFQWTYPGGWYVISGQGTSQIQLYCNDSTGQVCATGLDAIGNIVNTYCTAVTWGGGGSGWDAIGTQIGPCPYSPYSISIVPNTTGGNCAGCGFNGYASTKQCFAVYDGPLPSGIFVDYLGQFSAYSGGTFGTTYYVYLADTILGYNNPIIIHGGLCGGAVSNAVYVPPSNPPGPFPLVQTPNPACIGDTITVSDPFGTWSSYSWATNTPLATNIISNINDPVAQVVVTGAGGDINVVVADWSGCQFAGYDMIITTLCLTGCEIAFYPFHGNTADSSGNNINLISTSASLADDRFATPNEAYSFDGNDYMDFTMNFDYPERTIALWFYADSMDGNERYLFHDDHLPIQNARTVAYLKETSGLDSLYMEIGTTNNFAFPISKNQWYHIALVRRAGNIQYYVNGCLEATYTDMSNGNTLNFSNAAALGAGPYHSLNTRLIGRIDEVRIYQCALSDSAIQAIAGINCALSVPLVSFLSSDTAFCDKSNIDFTDLSTNSPTSWMWLFPGATPDTSYDQHPIGIYYQSQGTFDVTLIACNGFGCDTLMVPALITEFAPANVPIITISNDTLYASAAMGYQWFLAPDSIAGATGPWFVPQQFGTYFVAISDSNGCIATSNPVVINSIHENPASAFLVNFIRESESLRVTVELQGQASSSIVISMVDQTGRVVTDRIYDQVSGSKTYVIPTAQLAQGMYFTSIQAGSRQQVFKWIK